MQHCRQCWCTLRHQLCIACNMASLQQVYWSIAGSVDVHHANRHALHATWQGKSTTKTLEHCRQCGCTFCRQLWMEPEWQRYSQCSICSRPDWHDKAICDQHPGMHWLVFWLKYHYASCWAKPYLWWRMLCNVRHVVRLIMLVMTYCVQLLHEALAMLSWGQSYSLSAKAGALCVFVHACCRKQLYKPEKLLLTRLHHAFWHSVLRRTSLCFCRNYEHLCVHLTNLLGLWAK